MIAKAYLDTKLHLFLSSAINFDLCVAHKKIFANVYAETWGRCILTVTIYVAIAQDMRLSARDIPLRGVKIKETAKLILITNDLYDISARLRAINDDYRLYYNGEKRRYEVHSAKRCALQFVVPYDELDARTVAYAMYSRVENADTVFRDIERNNKEIK